MDGLIEPNIHPILVHFAYALSMTAAASYLLCRVFPSGRWTQSLRPAADWLLAFAAASIVVTIAAGFQAYYSVDHDEPSHIAMTTHRNWAVPSGSAILLLAVWRWRTRAKSASVLFVGALSAAALALTATAWWGGKIVYGYGLGVRSLPEVTGQGHDHHHGGKTDEAAIAAGHDEMASAPGHEHSDDEMDDGHHDEMAEGGHMDGPGSNHEADAGRVSGAAQTGPPEFVADAFSAALRSGDEDGLRAMMAPDAVIAEGGQAELSFEEYAGHHMKSDMSFMTMMNVQLQDRKVFQAGDMATVISQSEMNGTYKGEAVHLRSMETMVLMRNADGWKITHIHWSSSPLDESHAH